MSVEIIPEATSLPPLPPSASNPRPRGILKNASSSTPSVQAVSSQDSSAGGPPSRSASGNGNMQSPGGTNHLTWDEENLALTEVQKDSLMKITEPKTPYVRYNAELDVVENMSEIPSFDLGRNSGSNPSTPVSTSFQVDSPISQANNLPDTKAVTEANTSVNARRPSFGATPQSRSNSASSRSTSFHLPEDERKKIQKSAREAGGNGEVAEDDEMDEDAAVKHAEFVKARGRHYSNEAEAMKLAQKLLAEEDDEDEEGEEQGDGDDMDVDGKKSKKKGIPPVPPLPTNVNGTSS